MISTCLFAARRRGAAFRAEPKRRANLFLAPTRDFGVAPRSGLEIARRSRLLAADQPLVAPRVPPTAGRPAPPARADAVCARHVGAKGVPDGQSAQGGRRRHHVRLANAARRARGSAARPHPARRPVAPAGRRCCPSSQPTSRPRTSSSDSPSRCALLAPPRARDSGEGGGAARRRARSEPPHTPTPRAQVDGFPLPMGFSPTPKLAAPQKDPDGP